MEIGTTDIVSKFHISRGEYGSIFVSQRTLRAKTLFYVIDWAHVVVG
jgi:hypothetical protein